MLTTYLDIAFTEKNLSLSSSHPHFVDEKTQVINW